MKKPDTPRNENERLDVLRSLDILDTQSEERFDRLTRIAKRMFAVPIALVNFVDENRQWFKSCLGLEILETSREVSFCGHAILDKDVFVIENALEDARFADNPLVLNEPHIRFYAGCPLVVNGHRLGTLCVIDNVPRNFSNQDIEILKDLAAMVERELAAVQLATLDPLTGISNRRGFIALAQNSLNLSARNNFPVTLVYLDLDQFKLINDNFGHVEGDNVLIAFASLIRMTFRASDIFARMGGDEFVILLNSTMKDKADSVIENFKQSLQSYNQERDRGYEIAFSYGMLEFDHKKHNSIEALLSEGDKLMYALKKSKKEREKSK